MSFAVGGILARIKAFQPSFRRRESFVPLPSRLSGAEGVCRGFRAGWSRLSPIEFPGRSAVRYNLAKTSD